MNENAEPSWRGLYLAGAYATILVLIGIILDIVFGNITGGDVSALPATAIGRFEQFRTNPWLGLYNLDLLNIVNQILLIPVYVALYAAHRRTRPAIALLAMVVFLCGTVIFATTNTALPMLDLSRKYFAALGNPDQGAQAVMIASAGEAMLATGAHGSPGVFIGFLLPTLGSLLMALVMLSGKVFSKATAWLGITGNILMIVYFILVTFVPSTQSMAIALAMPGGLLLMIWMILFTVKFFKLEI